MFKVVLHLWRPNSSKYHHYGYKRSINYNATLDGGNGGVQRWQLTWPSKLYVFHLLLNTM
jgi:hypothetical protein